MMKCKGVNGTIIFDGTWLTIDRTRGILRSWNGRQGREEDSPHADHVGALEGTVSDVCVATSPSPCPVETRLGHASGTRPSSAAKDENAVIVAKSQTDEFLALKVGMEDALGQHHAPNTAAVAPSIGRRSSGTTEEAGRPPPERPADGRGVRHQAGCAGRQAIGQTDQDRTRAADGLAWFWSALLRVSG